MSYNRLYVSNLSVDASALELERCFATYGDVRHVELVAERHGGGSSSAFVVMGTTASAERAERGLNGTQQAGRSMMVMSAGRSADYPPDPQRGPRAKVPETQPKVAVTQQFRSRTGMVYEVACGAEQLTFCVLRRPEDSSGDWHIEASAKATEGVSTATGPTRQVAFDTLARSWMTRELDWPGIELVLKSVRAL